jgi:hypothetical protein
MHRHDSLFKGLLRGFFADLLHLLVPDLAKRLDLAHQVLLDKEFFTVGGRRRELDLLVQVPCLGIEDRLLLVHIEVEARARPDMGRRLWRYRRQIQAVHESHVLSIVIHLQRGRPGVRVLALDEDFLGPDLADFRYVAFGLAGCDAAEYLTLSEPLAWGLAALMRPGSLTRPELKLACLSKIVAADLEDTRRLLLVDCVEMYLELNSLELAEYAALCSVRENREVKVMASTMTWSERIAAQGREAGLQEGLRAVREILLSQLEQRFGPLPEEARLKVEGISSLDRLTRLGRRVLTARSLSALRLQ